MSAGSSAPPADLALGALLQEWLPAAYTKSGRSAAADAPRVRLVVSGSGGGTWEVQASGDGLDVAALIDPASGRSLTGVGICVRMSAADFRATYADDADLPRILPAGFGLLDLLFLDERDVELASKISGRFAVEIQGRRRRRFCLDIAIGTAGLQAGRPRSTVRLDGDTYEQLSRQTMAPLEALLKGKVQVDGDRTLATQAMLLVGARLMRGSG